MEFIKLDLDDIDETDRLKCTKCGYRARLMVYMPDTHYLCIRCVAEVDQDLADKAVMSCAENPYYDDDPDGKGTHVLGWKALEAQGPDSKD